VFWRITLPIILPGILAGALFAFITSWDEVVVSIFMTTARFRTLPVQMWEQVRQVVDPTVAAVATSLMAVTTITLVLVFVVRRQAPVR
jgi:putative spermidine/putrescine transport system permease protein